MQLAGMLKFFFALKNNKYSDIDAPIDIKGILKTIILNYMQVKHRA